MADAKTTAATALAQPSTTSSGTATMMQTSSTQHSNSPPPETVLLHQVDSVSSPSKCSIQTPEREELLDSLTFPVDEIPEPIKVLDDIISAFEDTSSRPQLQNNGENQSEDDGYMSLSRKNMKDKRDSEEMSQTSSACVPPDTLNECHDEVDIARFAHKGLASSRRDAMKAATHSATDQTDLVQSTLPKTRSGPPSNASNYSSLPCCGVRTSTAENKLRVGSCNGERNALGIDISAVHKAVLRGGVAKLPETIVNEHPVTIYPGRYSPASDNVGGAGRNSRPKRLITAVSKHKEVRHSLNPVSSSISSSSASSSPASTATSDRKTHSSSMNNTLEQSFRNTSEEDELSEDSTGEERCAQVTVSSQSTQCTSRGIAWEIHFKDYKKKTKSYKPLPDPDPETLPVNAKHSSSRPSRAPTKATRDFKSQTSVGVGSDLRFAAEFRNLERKAEMANSCNCPEASMPSMLGKGTFIIRRASPQKKPPRAMDIFGAAADDGLEKQGLSDSEPETESEGDGRGMDHLPHIASVEVHSQAELLESSERHCLELSKRAGTPLTSPRDRLSLDIEPQYQHNSLKKEQSSPGQPIAAKTTPEDVAARSRKGAFKPPEKECIGVMPRSPSQEENMAFDLANAFNCKCSANGLKGQEYNEMLLCSSNTTTPHTDLAPTLEEDEEQLSDFSYGCPPLNRIGNNRRATAEAAAAARPGESAAQAAKRPLEFRQGVHKSESAKEMLLSQNALGPLPPSPPTSNPDLFDYNALPLPPSPAEDTSACEDEGEESFRPYPKTTSAEIHAHPYSASREELRHQSTREKKKNVIVHRHMSDELPLPPPPPPPPLVPPSTFDSLAPAVPPHRASYSVNTMKSWSIDSHYRRKSPKMLGYGSGVTTPTSAHGPSCEGGGYGSRRYVSYGTKRSLKQSPREEHRLQTSCSLPETPIFARGCDIPRTPFRRQNENTPTGSRTAPRSSTSNSITMTNSVAAIAGGSTFGGAMCRQRSISHALASNEMLRLSGVPARGWYPKQRSMRPASTENIDRLTSLRMWDGAAGMSGTGHSRKPLTLPPNLTPSFLNKSPREALRRVTSLLITKRKNTKERKNKSAYCADYTLDVKPLNYDVERTAPAKEAARTPTTNAPEKTPKKKGIFKTLWKRTKHFSLDQ